MVITAVPEGESRGHRRSDFPEPPPEPQKKEKGKKRRARMGSISDSAAKPRFFCRGFQTDFSPSFFLSA